MNTSHTYTDMYSAEEMYDGDWDDLLRPDEYEEVLDRKRFNQSMGRNAWHNIRTNTYKNNQKRSKNN